MRVLMSEGSSLAARQSAGRLAALGHDVGVLSADPLCLARFTRHVRRVHRAPAFGADPLGWLDAALAVAGNGRYDVVFPTQEQVAVLSRFDARVRGAGLRSAVPAFGALVQVQDKVSAFATLSRLGIAQPDAEVVTTPAALRAAGNLPAFVKRPIGTATSGVTRVDGRRGLEVLADRLEGERGFEAGGMLVQQAVEGPLAMVQTVFARGRCVAEHANLRVRLGANGGASHKASIDGTEARGLVRRLGDELGWHGALSADVILTDAGPLVIDVNPRLVEPANAWLSGVDLVGATMEVACDADPVVRSPGRAGVRTHQLLLAVLGAAQVSGTRRAVLAELRAAAGHRGDYTDSIEELTPWRGDLRSAVPVTIAALATLARPALWRALASGAVDAYALTPDAWQAILGPE